MDGAIIVIYDMQYIMGTGSCECDMRCEYVMGRANAICDMLKRYGPHECDMRIRYGPLECDMRFANRLRAICACAIWAARIQYAIRIGYARYANALWAARIRYAIRE